MKKFIIFIACFLSFSCFASSDNTLKSSCQLGKPCPCAQAVPTETAGFCASFASIAQCHCSVCHGLPSGMCTNMETVYTRMIAAYKSVSAACLAQKDIVDPAVCMDDWKCYRDGGLNSKGLPCNATGRSCR